MKRLITVLLILLLVAFTAMLYSCGNDSTTSSTAPSTTASSKNPTAQDNHQHIFESTWTQTADGHYRACTCHPDEKVLSPHADSVDRDGKCDVCQHTVKEPTTFTLVLKDQDGNPITGAQVKIYTSSSDNTLTTDENGKVTADMKLMFGKIAEVNHYTADGEYVKIELGY